jgi:hypothetical protein
MRLYQALSCFLLASNTAAFLPSKQFQKSLLHQEGATSLRPTQTLNFSPQDFITASLEQVVGKLDTLNNEIGNTYASTLQSVLTQVKSLLSQEQGLQVEFTAIATKLLQEIDQWLLQQNPEVEQVFRTVLMQLSAAVSDNTPVAIALSTVVAYAAVSSILSIGEGPPPSKPYPLNRYDPVAARAYFDGKSLQALTRALNIGLNSLGFALSVLKDKLE